MLIDEDSLYLYHLTLHPSSNVLKSLVGNFIKDSKDESSQQILLVTSNHLQLLIPDSETGKLKVKSSQNLIGTINQCDKITIDKLDHLVITSDSGNLSILQYRNSESKFVSIHQEGYGKGGWNKIYPGELLTVDPRCILIGAMEKNKLIYKIQNDTPLLSDPLEANTKNLTTLQIISLHSEYGNPFFAALEIESNLSLNYYELDLGLNLVIKKYSNRINQDANYLLPLPSSMGGLFVFGKNWCCFEKIESSTKLYLPLPRRNDQNSIIVSHVTHVMRRGFFILIQNTFGDIFKIVIDYDHDREIIRNVKITYFDTIQPCVNLNILKSGFLFANVLNNDKLLYQFEKLGEDETENDLIINSIDYSDIDSCQNDIKTFTLKGLENLALIDIYSSLSPITDAKLIDSSISTICSHSYIKQVSPGQSTTTLVESPLPITPTDLFTTKLSRDSENDQWLIISSMLSNQTLVLSIGEVVEDVEDSNFILDQPTIKVQQVGSSAVIQVHSNGIRHVSNQKCTDWFPPAGITITKASSNNQQVLVSLSNLELVYFEIDSDDQLIEYQDRLEIQSSIMSIALDELNKSNYAIVGCSDETIQVVSLKPTNCLAILSLQALSSNSSSLLMMSIGYRTFVHIGMENGVYVRTELDLNGKLLDSRVKYLGSKPIKLSKVQLSDDLNGVLAISSKPWIIYRNNSNFKIVPLLDINITQGLSFVSEDIGGEGIVSFHGNNLIIFSIGKEDSSFDPNQNLTISKLKLRYQPRKMIQHGNKLIISESEYGIKPIHNSNLKKNTDQKVDEEFYQAFGYESEPNQWASCLQIIEKDSVLQSIQLESNEYITTMTKATFGKNQPYLIVGVAQNQTFIPTSSTSTYMLTFKLDKKKNLQFIHKTELDIYPTVIEQFGTKLILASKNIINLYELGSKQFLRKSQTSFDFISNINKLLICENRLWICDSNSFLTLAKFDPIENKFIPFANDIVKRQITSIIDLDFDTVLIGDKFGNVSVVRIDENVSKQSVNDWTILKQQCQHHQIPSHKLSCVNQFYIPDTITAFMKGSLIDSKQQCVIYAGVQGSLGFLLPLLTKSEIELLTNLQSHLQSFLDVELGRDFYKYRSYYNPIKNTIDGDYLEKFLELKYDEKVKLGKMVKKSVNEIEKKLIDLRNRCI